MAGMTQVHGPLTSTLSKNSQHGNRDAFLNLKYEVCICLRARLKTLSFEEQPSHDYSNIFFKRTVQNQRNIKCGEN